jgi:AbrB family looped-hinge helix DNA binding protein
MQAAARMTSKGQVTVPKAVRDALGLKAGDHVVFRVEGDRAEVRRTPDLLELAGSVPVPPELRGATWETIREVARRGMVERNAP